MSIIRTTEYLELPFLDLVAFNVYLEQAATLNGYLARLQNQAGDRPLLMTEIGLDSRQHGEQLQARQLASQVQAVFAAGCAGAFVFSWTDEWHRGGQMITDWSFGLTDVERNPKPAYYAISQVSSKTAHPSRSDTAARFRSGLQLKQRTDDPAMPGRAGEIRYPRYEVIVVDDGSTDNTAGIGTIWREPHPHDETKG